MKSLKLPEEAAAVPREEEEGEGDEIGNGRHRADDDTLSVSQMSSLSEGAATTDVVESVQEEEEETELSSLSDENNEEEEEEEGPPAKKAR